MKWLTKFSLPLGGCLIFCLLLGGVQLVNASELTSKKQQLHNVRAEAQQKRQVLKQYKFQEKTVLNDLGQLEKNITGREKQLKDLNQQLERNQYNVRLTQKSLDKAQNRLDEQTTILNYRLRDTYKNGTNSYLEVIFGAEDFSDFLSRLDYLARIIRQDVILINAIEEQKKKIQIQKAALEKKKQAITQIQSVVEAKREELHLEKEEKRQILAQIQAEKAVYEQQLNELEKSSNQLQSMIRNLQARSVYRPRIPTGNSGGVVHSSGRMIWPTGGTVTSPFGYRVHPIFHTRKLHTGLDISNGMGSPIVAAKAGVVIYSGWMSGYGQVIVIDHGGGISTLYGHCSALLVGRGTEVAQGQQIARVGSTGYSTGPHCHFEVRVNGTPVNPMGYL